MTEEFSCELLVIGAGPAGSSAAIAAAAAGYDVMLLDRKRVIGEPVACAGYIPAWITQHIKLDSSCIENEVEFMRTILPDGSIDDTRTPGYIVERSAFDRNLARTAIENGAKLFAGMNVTELGKGGALVRFKNKKCRIKADIIIGADGPKSIAGRYIGSEVDDFIIARQYEMVLKERMTHSEVYFDEPYTGGYGWLFPKGKFANVGLGIVRSDALKLPFLHDAFVTELVESARIIPESNVRIAEGLVPVDGPVRATVRNNVMLAGDAAGLTHPITGAGILSAVISGKLAGTVAAEALAKAKGGRVDNKLLKRYEQDWRGFLGSDLDLAVKRRKLLNGYFKSDHTRFRDLSEAERKCWVVFKGYYHDDK